MAEVHRIIEQIGRQGALQLDIDRRVIDIASGYMSSEELGIGFLYSGWAQAALPHRRLKSSAAWQVKSDHVTLLVEPGRRPGKDAEPEYVGVPYGSKARLIMLYLQTEALKTNSREIEIGKSLRSWLNRMGIPIGGKAVADVRDQAERIARCRLSFHIKTADSTGFLNQNIIDSGMITEYDDATGKPTSFLDAVKLSENFFQQLKRHPVPIEEAAIRHLNGHSQALDIYCWLAYRLHVLKKPTPVTWAALKLQFGPGVARMDHFRTGFLDNLGLALAVYPAAKVDVDRTGATLFPSPPPVKPKTLS
ncbi:MULTISPECIES: replication protein RepA [Gluconobacter]|uniref:Plasmid replication initiator n=1 Tax=Gluconobacter cadivus TaxID=2728101 RepID=A0ABR9YY42_9PROT|nr:MULTISPECIES: replication protein RepA [Gluconobacter]MBF0889483.1 plasmid replication initiator [Gluconobacter cadivus]MBS1035956.1 plasmid replication initiator [Gluconobacter cerinus]